MYRVQKILSLLGILSRRDCERKIMLGLVKINNELAKIGSKAWSDVTMSSDGIKIFAPATNSFIFISEDSGVTWRQTATSTSWNSISASSDGTKLIANNGTVGGGEIIFYEQVIDENKLTNFQPNDFNIFSIILDQMNVLSINQTKKYLGKNIKYLQNFVKKHKEFYLFNGNSSKESIFSIFRIWFKFLVPPTISAYCVPPK